MEDPANPADTDPTPTIRRRRPPPEPEVPEVAEAAEEPKRNRISPESWKPISLAIAMLVLFFIATGTPPPMQLAVRFVGRNWNLCLLVAAVPVAGYVAVSLFRQGDL